MNAIEAHIDSATIQAIAQLIVKRFDPEQIILFGSHARGEVGAHSDNAVGRPQGDALQRERASSLWSDQAHAANWSRTPQALTIL